MNSKVFELERIHFKTRLKAIKYDYDKINMTSIFSQQNNDTMQFNLINATCIYMYVYGLHLFYMCTCNQFM